MVSGTTTIGGAGVSTLPDFEGSPGGGIKPKFAMPVTDLWHSRTPAANLLNIHYENLGRCSDFRPAVAFSLVPASSSSQHGVDLKCFFISKAEIRDPLTGRA